jgi:predicted DNA binding CopG/RHH family protein
LGQNVREAHVRLFAADIAELKRRAAARGVSWQIELRLVVRQALREPAIIQLEPPEEK